jgi:hypothetical protein
VQQEVAFGKQLMDEWFPISDSIFKSSAVGAITVAPSDANVVYVGMGEADMRSNSFGDGINL